MAADPAVTVRGVPWLTLSLLLGCLWVLAAAGGLRSGLSVASLLAFGAKATPLILDKGETWRLFTANLLHKDLLHFAFNAFAIWNMGGPLERAVRPSDYLALLIATALGTTAASTLLADSISLGASGMAFGVLAAAAAFGWRRGVRGPLKAHFGLRLLPWLFALFAAGLGSSGVDNWGHAGGLAAGALLGLFLSPRTDRPDGALRRLAGCLGTLACALALGLVAAPSLPLLGSAREGPLGSAARFPVGWRRADGGLERLSYTNGLSGGFRSSATVWSAAPGAGAAAACRDGVQGCSCEHADALVRWLVETELYRLADVGTLRGVDVAAPEALRGAPASAPVFALRGAALGTEGQAQIAALCTASQGAPLALVVFMPPGSGDAPLRLARRMLAAVREAEGPAAPEREGTARAQ
jgi:membrane associated rhomboid family serine protease